MITPAIIRQIALSFANSTEEPHFEKTSFRFKKKIFATLDERSNKVVVKLTPMQQSVYCTINSLMIYPVPNKWGNQGWTMISLELIEEDLFTEVVKVAYENVANSKKVR